MPNPRPQMWLMRKHHNVRRRTARRSGGSFNILNTFAVAVQQNGGDGSPHRVRLRNDLLQERPADSKQVKGQIHSTLKGNTAFSDISVKYTPSSDKKGHLHWPAHHVGSLGLQHETILTYQTYCLISFNRTTGNF